MREKSLNPFSGIWTSVWLPFLGIKLLFTRKGYLKYAWVSSLLNAAFYALALYLLFRHIFPWIDSLFPVTAHTGFFYYLYASLEYLIKIIISLSFLVISILFFNTIFFSICAPYLDSLSLAIEKDFFSFTPANGVKNLTRSILISMKNAFRLNLSATIWALLLFPLNFIIPLLGFLPGMIAASYFLGLSFVIFSSEHRLENKKAFQNKLSGNRLKVLAFGLVIYIILFVPFTAILFIPGAIIGGTFLYNTFMD